MDTLTGTFTTGKHSHHRAPYPPAVGLNSSTFYQRYDALAEEIDEDMVKGLKEHLDGLLIFAGLFAGVNSAFLALTLPLLKADPVDDTNAILLQNNALLLHLALGRNGTPPTSFTLPSSTFGASSNILAINILFSISLAFALISSFLAVLGRQWLVYYRKRSGGGPDRERWEQLKRYLGAEKWHLQFVLDDILPSLLQIGLIMFCISLILYLHILHPTVSQIVGIPLYIGLGVALLGAICTIWDEFCPFHSPLSRFVLWATSAVRRVLGYCQTKEGGEERASLHATAIKRAISTSDDHLTLLLAAESVLTIESGSLLKQLWNDDLFRIRILELCTRSSERFLHLKPGDLARDSASAAARLFRAVLAHMILSLDNEVIPDSIPHVSKLVNGDGNTVSLWLIPQEDIQCTSAALVHASLAFSLLRSCTLQAHINSLSSFLASYSNGLVGAGWNSVALMVLAINLLVPDGRYPKHPDNYIQLPRLKQVYSGGLNSASMTVKDIEKAVSALAERQFAKRLDCDAVLVNIMHSVAELVFGQDHPPDLTTYEKVNLLMLMERNSGPHLRQVRSKVRRQMFATVRNSFATQAETRNSSAESFLLLEMFFRELRINRPIDGLSIDDDREILDLFAEVLQDLRQYGFKTSRDDSDPLSQTGVRTHPATIFREAFGYMLTSYMKFQSHVGEASRFLPQIFIIPVASGRNPLEAPRPYEFVRASAEYDPLGRQPGEMWDGPGRNRSFSAGTHVYA